MNFGFTTEARSAPLDRITIDDIKRAAAEMRSVIDSTEDIVLLAVPHGSQVLIIKPDGTVLRTKEVGHVRTHRRHPWLNVESKAAEPLPDLTIREGDVVDVIRDDGSVERRSARSDPWQLGHGEWVISLTGISGGYMLSRCTKVEGGAK